MSFDDRRCAFDAQSEADVLQPTGSRFLCTVTRGWALRLDRGLERMQYMTRVRLHVIERLRFRCQQRVSGRNARIARGNAEQPNGSWSIAPCRHHVTDVRVPSGGSDSQNRDPAVICPVTRTGQAAAMEKGEILIGDTQHRAVLIDQHVLAQRLQTMKRALTLPSCRATADMALCDPLHVLSLRISRPCLCCLLRLTDDRSTQTNRDENGPQGSPHAINLPQFQ